MTLRTGAAEPSAVGGAAAMIAGCVPGRVHLVGAGPGPVELLTLRAARLLATADLVAHDQLVTEEVLALVPAEAELVAVGRRQGRVVASHDEVISLLARAAVTGRRVVRLKGGDPVVLGRGGEEALDLARRGVPSELVSGVTSAVAAPELAGIPVTHRGVAAGFLVLTAARAPEGRWAEDAEDWEAAARFSGTVVVLMGATRLAETCERLQLHGRSGATPAAVVSRAGSSEQAVVTGTLAELPALTVDAGVPAPAVVVIGEVAEVPGRVERLLQASRATSCA